MRFSRIIWVLLPLVLSTGCGYTADRPFSGQLTTVHVEMFRTHDFRRDLEFRLTEAVVKRIEMDTPYRIATRKNADSVLTGEVVEVREATLGIDSRTDLPIETATSFVVSFRWLDLRSGKIMAQRKQLPYTTTYIRPVGESFFDSAVRGLDGLAERIVECMESEW